MYVNYINGKFNKTEIIQFKIVYLSRSGELELEPGLRQLVLALLTLSREGWRSLGTQHAIQWRKKRKKEDDKEKKIRSKKNEKQTCKS